MGFVSLTSTSLTDGDCDVYSMKDSWGNVMNAIMDGWGAVLDSIKLGQLGKS